MAHRDEWPGRLERARSFQHSAEVLLALSEGNEHAATVLSNVAMAAIAYGDALTLKFRGTQNTRDHRTLPREVRTALGKQANESQLKRLADLINLKSEAQYSHRPLSKAEAEQGLEKLKRFAEWAESRLH